MFCTIYIYFNQLFRKIYKCVWVLQSSLWEDHHSCLFSQLQLCKCIYFLSWMLKMYSCVVFYSKLLFPSAKFNGSILEDSVLVKTTLNHVWQILEPTSKNQMTMIINAQYVFLTQVSPRGAFFCWRYRYYSWDSLPVNIFLLTSWFVFYLVWK